MRLAVVHEWVAARTGSELVFEAMAQTFPEADLFALTAEPGVIQNVGDRPITTTFLDHSVLQRSRALQLPLMPAAWRALARGHRYDVVVSSTHAFSRVFAERMNCTHLSYVHAPMRYAWSPEIDARGRLLAGPGRRLLQRRDLRTVQSVTGFAANSRAVRERIREYYDRDAEVIPPPVDVDYFLATNEEKGDYVLAASRWIPYKHLDLAILAAAHVGMPIKVAGSGPEEARLRALAAAHHPSGVEFVVQPDRAELRRLMAGARAFVFPANEDFGIIAVEAQAAGTPVVGLASGGTLDTVAQGRTGILADEQTVESIAHALQACLDAHLAPADCRQHAMGFSRARFDARIQAWVTNSTD